MRLEWKVKEKVEVGHIKTLILNGLLSSNLKFLNRDLYEYKCIYRPGYIVSKFVDSSKQRGVIGRGNHTQSRSSKPGLVKF